MGCDLDCTTIGIGSSYTPTASAFQDADGNYLNSATGYWYLLDPDGETVLYSGAMSYVSASDGDYTGVISVGTTSALTNGVTYWVRVTLTQGQVTASRQLTATAGFPS